MKPHNYFLCTAVIASTLLAAGCGDQGMEEEVDESLETNTSAVLASVSKGTTIKVVEGVNLRTGPGTGFAVILVVPVGATAMVLSGTPTDGFYKINYQGNVGWSHGDYWNAVSGLVINGNTLNVNQDKWVRWIASKTVPALSGTRDQRLTKAARVAWWSLKEGVLDLNNPFPYSNCNGNGIGALSVCSVGFAWQAGISGIQPRGVSLASSESVATSLNPGLTIPQVLGSAAVQAGYASGSATYNSIVSSTGDLRNSWLVRHHAVAFTQQEPIITNECIVDSKSWCYSNAWYPSSAYSPSKPIALQSINEMKAVFDALAP